MTNGITAALRRVRNEINTIEAECKRKVADAAVRVGSGGGGEYFTAVDVASGMELACKRIKKALEDGP